MLRGPKHSKIEVVAPKEEVEDDRQLMDRAVALAQRKRVTNRTLYLSSTFLILYAL
jgi:hypothetical protein